MVRFGLQLAAIEFGKDGWLKFKLLRNTAMLESTPEIKDSSETTICNT